MSGGEPPKNCPVMSVGVEKPHLLGRDSHSVFFFFRISSLTFFSLFSFFLVVLLTLHVEFLLRSVFTALMKPDLWREVSGAKSCSHPQSCLSELHINIAWCSLLPRHTCGSH